MTTAFAIRRAALMEHLRAAGGGIALIPTAPERVRNHDAHYPYRPDSSFHYLTGFPEPEAVLLLCTEPAQAILFCREKNLEREIWDGFRFGPEAAAERFALDAAYPIAEFDTKFVELLGNQPALWTAVGHDSEWDARVTKALNAVRANSRSGKRAPGVLRDVRATIDEMRLIKDADELKLMRRAGEISAAGHVRAMRACAPGKFEYEIEAELLHEFRRHGCAAPAYTSIVAGGGNACVLHYISNDQMLRDGDLLLLDAGGEFDGYASDITRTFPVNGRFSSAQRDVYQVVLAAQEGAIAALQPGASFNDYHDVATRLLVQGMLDLQLLSGTVDGAIESGSFKRFYMHRAGHWLGRDVHDCGEYKISDAWRPLKPGMVVTVEPGCYIRPADDVPEAFWNIGIRIEDDLVITEGGSENLTAGVPKTVAGIEALMENRA